LERNTTNAQLSGHDLRKCHFSTTKLVGHLKQICKLNQYTINVHNFKLTVGKYQKRNPGIVGIYFDNPQFSVPGTAYDTIQRALGSVDDTWIPCDINIPIVLTAGGVNLKVSFIFCKSLQLSILGRPRYLPFMAVKRQKMLI
jgi:hypothetical protein